MTYGPFDKQLELRNIADGAETTSVDETGIAFPAAYAGDFKAIVFVSALNTGGNQTYVVSISTNSVVAFSDTPVTIGAITVTATGVYELPLSAGQIVKLDDDAAAIRVGVTIGGTSTSITYGAFLVPV